MWGRLGDGDTGDVERFEDVLPCVRKVGQAVLDLDRVDAQWPVRSVVADECEGFAQVIDSAGREGRGRGADRTEAHQTFHCGQGVESRVISVGFEVCGRLPTGLDDVIAQAEEMVGGVPGIGGKGTLIPGVVGLGHERPVLCDADGTVDGRSCGSKPGLQDAEETERAGDDCCAGGAGASGIDAVLRLPRGSIEGPPELDVHPCSSLTN